MTDRVLVNHDRTALLPPNSPHKGYLIARADAERLGLLDSADKPTQARRTSTTAQKRRSAPRKAK